MLRRSQTSHELASAKVQEKQRPDGTLLKNDRSNLENLAFRTEMIQMQKENDTCRKVSGGDGRVFPLLRLSGLSLWLAPGIPEGGDVKGVVLNIIDHLNSSTWCSWAEARLCQCIRTRRGRRG